MYVVENDSGELYNVLHMVKSAGISIHRALISSDKKIHVNQRHASINNLPEKYKNIKKIIVIRNPEDWYVSFYRFFLGVEGYLSFMLNDPSDPHDGYIYPINVDIFVERSHNFKETLIKFPNKARVFNNLLRSQDTLHFVTGYFQEAIDSNNPKSYDQFDFSLYKWFWKNIGGDEAIFIPMDKLEVVEELLDIKIGHINKTNEDKPKSELSKITIKKLKESHREFYQMIDDFDPENLRTYKEWQEWRKTIDALKQKEVK